MSMNGFSAVGICFGTEHLRLVKGINVAESVAKAENILNYRNTFRGNSRPVIALILKSAVRRRLFIGFLTAVKQIYLFVHRNKHKILPRAKNGMLKPFFGAKRLVDKPASALKAAFARGVLCGKGKDAAFCKKKRLFAEHAEPPS